MTSCIDSLEQILDRFDVAVVDQWGVLHQGKAPYPHALGALQLLHGAKPVVILTNSGKRAQLNRQRVVKMGFADHLFEQVVSSGEVAWQQLDQEKQPLRVAPIEGRAGDARQWVGTSELITVADAGDDFDVLLIMGMPDDTQPETYDELLHRALDADRPALCTNPDLHTPRGDRLVAGPGSVAARFAQLGGTVTWYGKPHRTVFDAVAKQYAHVPRNRLLMIGDTLGNDIAGAAAAGFASLLIASGVHAHEFSGPPDAATVAKVCASHGVPQPDFAMAQLA